MALMGPEKRCPLEVAPLIIMPQGPFWLHCVLFKLLQKFSLVQLEYLFLGTQEDEADA